MDANKRAVSDAIKFLRKHDGSPKILVKQIRNLGDTLHLTPIIHHYRILHPNAAIAFVVGQWYHNIHEHNPHINQLFLADHNATPQQRLALWDLIHGARGIDIKIIASIFPFGEVHPRNKWCHETIADQYLFNGGITTCKPAGGRDLVVKITDQDKQFASQVFQRHSIEKLVVFEFVSYSRPPVWQKKHFTLLAKVLRKRGIKCATIAAAQEPLVGGTLDLRGITWRQTVALLNRSIAMVGVGSGITMLAAAARPQPRIIELGIANSVSMKGCGYAPSISLPNPTVESVSQLIMEVAG
jgi:ADP-heptose:LPS heptosyltransferase